GSLVGTTDLVCETAYERDSFIFMVEKIKEAFTSLYFKVVLGLCAGLVVLFFSYRYYIGKRYEKMQKVHRRTK
ncbi:MAG: hypothetical protein RR827_07985, partial [Oscillospiraceae bacterium]